MTADELAKELKVSRRTIFRLRSAYPDEAPEFSEVEKWRRFIASGKVDIDTDKTPGPKPSATNISYAEARARKTHYGAELLQIQLAATKKNVVPKEDVLSLFANVGAVARGRFMKMVNDLPCALVGLDAAAIDRIIRERTEHALAAFNIPVDFFQPDSLVK